MVVEEALVLGHYPRSYYSYTCFPVSLSWLRFGLLVLFHVSRLFPSSILTIELMTTRVRSGFKSLQSSREQKGEYRLRN